MAANKLKTKFNFWFISVLIFICLVCVQIVNAYTLPQTQFYENSSENSFNYSDSKPLRFALNDKDKSQDEYVQNEIFTPVK